MVNEVWVEQFAYKYQGEHCSIQYIVITHQEEEDE